MTHPFLVSLILIRIPDDDFDIAIGMVGANDSVGEFITTPFAEGLEEAFDHFDEEPDFEGFWRAELLDVPLIESAIVDKYFKNIDNPVFFLSEPFIIDELGLSPIIAHTHATLKGRRFRVSKEKRFEHLLSG